MSRRSALKRAADVAAQRMKEYKAYCAKPKGKKRPPKPTAADSKALLDWAAFEESEKAKRSKPREDVGPMASGLNGGATAEEDLEEWVLREGVVGGVPVRLGALAVRHGLTDAQAAVVAVQRRLLGQYGWEGATEGAALTGDEAMAFVWVKSINRLSRALAEWEISMEARQRSGNRSNDIDGLATLASTVKSLTERVDMLVLRVRKLSLETSKAKAAGQGAGAQRFLVMIEGEEEEGREQGAGSSEQEEQAARGDDEDAGDGANN